MIEYARHLEEYQDYNESSFSTLVPEPQWGNKLLAETYLKKYWLSESEYQAVWKPIQDQIFLPSAAFPQSILQPKYQFIALTGGCLFLEDDFRHFQKAITQVGDSQFVVIQSSQEYTTGEPMFRMKYPANISWEELISGDYISAVIFGMGYNEYYVFGTTGLWAKYSATDNEHPFYLISFQPDVAHFFTKEFNQSREEQDRIYEHLPPEYKFSKSLLQNQHR